MANYMAIPSTSTASTSTASTSTASQEKKQKDDEEILPLISKDDLEVINRKKTCHCKNENCQCVEKKGKCLCCVCRRYCNCYVLEALSLPKPPICIAGSKESTKKMIQVYKDSCCQCHLCSICYQVMEECCKCCEFCDECKCIRPQRQLLEPLGACCQWLKGSS